MQVVGCSGNLTPTPLHRRWKGRLRSISLYLFQYSSLQCAFFEPEVCLSIERLLRRSRPDSYRELSGRVRSGILLGNNSKIHCVSIVIKAPGKTDASVNASPERAQSAAKPVGENRCVPIAPFQGLEECHGGFQPCRLGYAIAPFQGFVIFKFRYVCLRCPTAIKILNACPPVGRERRTDSYRDRPIVAM